MKEYFSGPYLIDLQENISRSLIDTFELMFQMNVTLIPANDAENSEKFIYSYTDLSCEGMHARLALAISQTAVEVIGQKVAPNTFTYSEIIKQDIVCEIINIAGSHLRSYISDRIKSNSIVNMTFPCPGEPPDLAKTDSAVHLDFRLMESENMRLDLSYHPTQTSCSLNSSSL